MLKSLMSVVGSKAFGNAAPVLGSLATGLFNQRSANKQMQFQDTSSRTQYQRAVADMKAAGLNPMLATKLGGNAAMSGASASMPDLGAIINSAQSISNQGKKIDQEIKNLKLDEVAKDLSNQSKEILVNFEKSLSDADYKMYKMGLLKMAASVLGVGDAAQAAGKSGFGQHLGGMAKDPFTVIENAFKYVQKNSDVLIQEYGMPVYVEFVKSWRKFAQGEQ